MAGFKSQMTKWYDKIPDWVWPHLTGKPEPYKDEQLSIATDDANLLSEVEHVLDMRNSQVDERLRNIETKLVALLTLTSVLSAALTASFTAISIMGTPKDYLRVPIWIVVIIVFYITISLLRSLWTTVNGLVRRGYKQLGYEDMVPGDREDSIHYKIRILNERLKHINWNEYILNKKVSEMAVAHEALRNALCATAGLILLALAITVIKLI